MDLRNCMKVMETFRKIHIPEVLEEALEPLRGGKVPLNSNF